MQQKKIIFKCSHARGNPTAVGPSTRSIKSQKQSWMPNKIALSVKSGLKHSKWSLKSVQPEHIWPKTVYILPFCPCSRVQQLLTSHGSATLPWGSEKYSEENKAALPAEELRSCSRHSLGSLAEWEQSKAWAPLCYLGTACSVHQVRLRPREKMNQWL